MKVESKPSPVSQAFCVQTPARYDTSTLSPMVDHGGLSCSM